MRDNVICKLLGVGRFKNYEVDYQIFRELMRDQEVQRALTTLIDQVQEIRPELPIDTCRLRILDVALWTYGVWQPR